MKVSIVIPVLNSHEIVRRQELYWSKLNLEDVEIILVDDGSNPPLKSDIARVIPTNDFRKWTHPKARNIGIKEAKGEVLIVTDIDHILTQEIIDLAKNFKYDYGRFRRELAILDKNGELTQDRRVLRRYGVPRKQRLRVPCHILSMIVKADIMAKTGGYKENLGKHPTHDDGFMKRQLRPYKKSPDKNPDLRPKVYVFPNGRFCNGVQNPHNWFHDLER